MDLISEARVDKRPLIAGLLEELQPLVSESADIAAYVERLRDLQLFKIRHLKMLRNNVVHKALYQDDRMAYYA